MVFDAPLLVAGRSEHDFGDQAILRCRRAHVSTFMRDRPRQRAISGRASDGRLGLAVTRDEDFFMRGKSKRASLGGESLFAQNFKSDDNFAGSRRGGTSPQKGRRRRRS
ncbi:hypothetical protein OV079_45875 [Nannocystis pusilla]|uniref:Uncharacterized protein n=1 Tax=Nannocystis pusilla TaxID=889268 RepID=A0A9X3J2J9_9BACT|nr:hypothetical protein [Nannocystis pusilla]MCY1012746.1 hypothetical protein [Nannocystis pusilla]